MSDISQGPGWWIASDAKWYAPEQHPDYGTPQATTPPVPPTSPPIAVRMAEQMPPPQVVTTTRPDITCRQCGNEIVRDRNGQWVHLSTGNPQCSAVEVRHEPQPDQPRSEPSSSESISPSQALEIEKANHPKRDLIIAGVVILGIILLVIFAHRVH